MPSQVMDQRRHLSQFSNSTLAASSFSEELRLPTERQVGFWKPEALPHHIGSKSVASSPIEKPQPIGTKTAGRVDLQPYKLMDQKTAFSLEHKIFGQERHVNLPPSLWRADQDPNHQSDSSLFPDGRRTNPNEAYNENGLFSSSLSEIFDKKLRLGSKNVLVRQPVEKVDPTHVDDEPFELTQEIEAQIIGNILPDDDDLLSGVLDEVGYPAHANNGDDVDDDIFYSGGGMELETDENKKHTEPNGGANEGLGLLNGTLNGEHPNGEHPSRTLFVRNINSNVEDSELKLLFEHYGEISNLYTACKHRGFVMISYYDIRSARNAMRSLQNKPLRRRARLAVLERAGGLAVLERAGAGLAVVERAGAAAAAARREEVVPAAAGNGRSSYEVESLIERLSNLPPRGSIARCLEMARHRLTLQDFAAVYREFSRRGDWQRSMRLFKYMQRQSWCRPDEHIHAIVIGVLGRQGPALLDKCLEVFHDLPAESRTALSYTSLIAAYARNALHEEARALLDQMKATGVAPTAATYNTVLAACARATDPPVPFDMLLGLFAEMRHDMSPSVRPDLTTYNTLLAAAAVRSLADQSEMLLRTMLEAGVSPDTVSYRHIVDAFASAGNLSRVAELFSEMAATGQTPDASAYLGLMEAHTRVGATAEAVAVLRQMQADGCAPTPATYRVLLDLYGSQGRFDGVRELFREMRTAVPPDTATYNVLFRVFGDGGFFKEVVELFRDMLQTGVEPDMVTCENVMAACGRGGLHEDAREVLEYMTREGMVPTADAYTGLVEALGHAAMYEEAYVAFNMMTEIGSLPTIETYNALANAYAKGGLFQEAEAIFSRMINNAGIQKNKDSFDALIEAYCQGSQLDDAVKAYMEMRKSRFNPDERSLEGVLNAYCIAGVVDESKEQFEELQSSVTVPSIISYCMMLSLYARNDRWTDAYDLLEEMKTNRASSTHQVIASLIKGEYDDGSNWQIVEYTLENSTLEGCDYSLRFFNALLDVLWWFCQKARAARVLDQAVKFGLFPELYRDTKLVWSLDVHRMSVGGALVAVSVWLNKLYDRLKGDEDLPQLASVVVLRGEMEKSTITRGLPTAKVVYSFLNDTLSASFHFPKWNKGRIICLKSQLKKLRSATESSNGSATAGFIPMTDSHLPSPDSKIYTREAQVDNGTGHLPGEPLVEEKESELLPL